MSKPQSATNPFFMLLIVASVLFVITAFAYFTMAIREAEGAASASHGLTWLLARHGLSLLIAELLLLAVATCGAIGTDDYWNRRAAERSGVKAIATDTEVEQNKSSP